MNDIYITYDGIHGLPIADGNADNFVSEWIARSIEVPVYRTVSTENIIYAMRVAIKQQRISHERVWVIFKGEHMQFDSSGNLIRDGWPDGFCDYIDQQLGLLIF